MLVVLLCSDSAINSDYGGGGKCERRKQLIFLIIDKLLEHMFSGLQCFEDSSFIHPYLTPTFMINCTKCTSLYLVFHVREVDGPEQRHNVDVCNSKMGGNEIEVNHLEK